MVQNEMLKNGDPYHGEYVLGEIQKQVSGGRKVFSTHSTRTTINI